jgi:hypothetical protein
MYRFETNNGCATCDAMEGLYEEAPDRPHEYCRCIISVVDDDLNLAGAHFDRTGDGWSWTAGDITYGTDEDGDGYGEHFRTPGVLSVECCDGKTMTGEDYDLEYDWDPRGASSTEEQNELLEAALRAAEVAMRQRARELMEADCDPCPQYVS